MVSFHRAGGKWIKGLELEKNMVLIQWICENHPYRVRDKF